MKEHLLELIKQQIEQDTLNKTWVAGKDWVKYAGPFFDGKEQIAAINAILNGWLVLGKDALMFERLFPQYFGKKYGVLTNSGSSANLLMMLALKSKKSPFTHNQKVIVPIAGFPTTVNPILQAGFEPLFVDIEVNTLNIDIAQLEEMAKKNPGSILTFAHVLGNPPNMDAVMDIVTKYSLILLEDCCDALNSKYDGKYLGSFGEMASCSFYPAHHITMGEGGFVSTKTREFETIVRSLREWGRGCYCVGETANLLKDGTCKCRFNNWLPSMPDEVFDHKYVYEEIGYNLKPIELQASMGLEQIKKLDAITNLRKRNFQYLTEIFKPYEEYFILPKATEKSDPNWFAFPLTIKDGTPFKRSDICGFLEENKIQTRPYFGGNLMLQPAYAYLLPQSSVPFRYSPEWYKTEFPVATKVTTDTFFLGVSPVITLEQLEYIKLIVTKFFNKGY